MKRLVLVELRILRKYDKTIIYNLEIKGSLNSDIIEQMKREILTQGMIRQ